MKDKIKELYYQSNDYSEDLISFIVKETIWMFEQTYGFLRVFYEEPIDLSLFESFKTDYLDDLLKFIKEKEEWLWPDHNQITCLSNIVPKKFKIAEIRIGKDIGFINIK